MKSIFLHSGFFVSQNWFSFALYNLVHFWYTHFNKETKNQGSNCHIFRVFGRLYSLVLCGVPLYVMFSRYFIIQEKKVSNRDSAQTWHWHLCWIVEHFLNYLCSKSWFMFQKLVYVPKDASKIQMSDTCENRKPWIALIV